MSVSTPLGEGWAHFLVDYGHDWNTCWIIQIYQTGEIKHFDSNDIRINGNPTYGTENPNFFTQDSTKGK